MAVSLASLKKSIFTAFSAREADQILSCNIDVPFDFIFTDMQMETDFLPLNAGEWVIKQAQFYPEYKNTRIVIISASPVIEKLAEKYNVEFIPKRLCQTTCEYEKILKMSGASMFGTGASEKLQHILAQRWRAFEIGRESNPSSHITSWMSSHTFAHPTTATDEDIWLKAACEIIIYGQASKNADVYIKGEKIALNEDGSFSFRFPLSEGQVVDMPIKAQHKTKGEKQRFITIKAKREEA